MSSTLVSDTSNKIIETIEKSPSWLKDFYKNSLLRYLQKYPHFEENLEILDIPREKVFSKEIISRKRDLKEELKRLKESYPKKPASANILALAGILFIPIGIALGYLLYIDILFTLIISAIIGGLLLVAGIYQNESYKRQLELHEKAIEDINKKVKAADSILAQLVRAAKEFLDENYYILRKLASIFLNLGDLANVSLEDNTGEAFQSFTKILQEAIYATPSWFQVNFKRIVQDMTSLEEAVRKVISQDLYEAYDMLRKIRTKYNIVVNIPLDSEKDVVSTYQYVRNRLQEILLLLEERLKENDIILKKIDSSIFKKAVTDQLSLSEIARIFEKIIVEIYSELNKVETMTQTALKLYELIEGL